MEKILNSLNNDINKVDKRGKNKRAILIVMDSMGVGELPDAEKYGDRGADTLGHIAKLMGDDFKIPNLRKLGLCNISNILGGKYKVESPIGSYGKLKELSAGKDTITGHWEFVGIETKEPFKTYPNGFPKEFIDELEKEIGMKVIGNYPASGTEIIEELGEKSEKLKAPIVYTSADSVFQIAANVDIIPLEKLYSICEVARKLLKGDWACGRVIARPYVIEEGERKRTSDRHDYAVTPPQKTVLNHIEEAGDKVYAVGKIKDIFNGYGITEGIHTKDNMDGVDKTIEAMKMDFRGLIFTNLVDFDSKFGHRRDPLGYGKAIMEFDRRIPEILEAMKDEDILILCADHGNDPVHKGFDHTREYIPCLVYGKNIQEGTSFGIRETFADIGDTIADYLGVKGSCIGKSFLPIIEK